MARRPYTTDARFFSDSDQVVKVRWYPVAEPVECLPFPCKINSLDWSSHPYLAKGVGEVFGAARSFNAKKALPYAVGLTPCEPAEMFRTGEPRDPSLPPQKYNEDGFALCCLDRFTATGGVLWSGAGVVNVLPAGTPISNLCATATPWNPHINDHLDFILTATTGWVLMSYTGPPITADLSFDSCTDAAAIVEVGGSTCPPSWFPFVLLHVGNRSHGGTFGAGFSLARITSTVGAGVTGRLRMLV